MKDEGGPFPSAARVMSFVRRFACLAILSSTATTMAIMFDTAEHKVLDDFWPVPAAIVI